MSLDQIHLLPEWAQQEILNGPALVPPSGAVPNFDNPPNRIVLGLILATICLSISTMAIALAAYAKLHCVKKVHFEDFFSFSGYALLVGVCYCGYDLSFSAGWSVHQWNVRVKDLAHVFYMVHVGSLLYSVGIMLLKIAILLQWVRVFVPRGTKGSFYWTCHALIGINILLYLAIVIAVCVSCKPFRRIWDKTVPGTCSASRDIIDISTAVGNLISDLIILILPQRVIWKLQIKPRKKIGIAFIFLVGIFTIISAGFRVDASVHFFKSEDKTYQVFAVALWGIAELTCAILLFCVPSIPKIFRDSRLSIKFPTSFASWIKLPTKRNKYGPSSTWPSFESNRLPVDTLREPHHGNDMAVRQYNSAKAQSWQLETQNRALDDMEYPQAGILRTTRIIATEEPNTYTRNENFSQFQPPWNSRRV
ncbi:hypothetical protein HD806DRAFT_531530 [Xylariaceae sp. AK1471]|nr:hypothetical protein HD806DRAFT_531530 [Xylariaceae sp. AK1471]